MPLAHLIDYFNHQYRLEYGEHADAALVQTPERRIQARFAGLTLDSAFQPIIRTDTGATVAHEALLRATAASQRRLSPASVFMLPTAAGEVVLLDRLCRTLHALNALLLELPAGQLLALNVHPRHLTSVLHRHGQVFEAVLRQLGLSPQQVILEISAAAVLQVPHLQQAVDNYRARGYRLALDDVPVQAAPQPAWLAWQPDWIKLDLRSGPLDWPALNAWRREWPSDAELVAVGATAAQLPHLADLGIQHAQGDQLAPPRSALTRSPLSTVQGSVQS